MTDRPISRRRALLAAPALAAMAAVPAPTAAGWTVAHWPMVDRMGRLAAYRVVMTREAWEALPAGSQPDCVLDESGTIIAFEEHIPEEQRTAYVYPVRR